MAGPFAHGFSQEIMRVSSLLKHQPDGDFERLPPMARPNQMHHHQSPPMPNFCGNGFGPWNHGAHPERVGFPQGPVGWQGAPQSPSPYIVKKILRLKIPTDTYPNVRSFMLASVLLVWNHYLLCLPYLFNSILLAVFLGQGETR